MFTVEPSLYQHERVETDIVARWVNSEQFPAFLRCGLSRITVAGVLLSKRPHRSGYFGLHQM
jgi:hypothetical protein